MGYILYNWDHRFSASKDEHFGRSHRCTRIEPSTWSSPVLVMDTFFSSSTVIQPPQSVIRSSFFMLLAHLLLGLPRGRFPTAYPKNFLYARLFRHAGLRTGDADTFQSAKTDVCPRARYCIQQLSSKLRQFLTSPLAMRWPLFPAPAHPVSD